MIGIPSTILLFFAATNAATVNGFAITTSPPSSSLSSSLSSSGSILPTMMTMINSSSNNRNCFYHNNNNNNNNNNENSHKVKQFQLYAKNDKADDEDSDDDDLVTKEMFLKDSLGLNGEQGAGGGAAATTRTTTTTGAEEGEEGKEGEQQQLKEGMVKRKKRNGKHYRVLDNRDNLPFLVKVTTPDPYTNNEVMQKKARKNTEQFAKGANSKKNKKSKDMKSKRHNLIGMDGVDSIASSIYMRKRDGTLDQILGEFKLDKSTNCGDIVDVGGGVEYQVQKARCQYKYVGGKKFVMTRKILEVKEVKRLLVEKEVKQLFEKDGSNSDDDDVLRLE